MSLNYKRKLHTSTSWEFLGLENNGTVPMDSDWEKARYGEDRIIGNLDTGQFHIVIVKAKLCSFVNSHLL